MKKLVLFIIICTLANLSAAENNGKIINSLDEDHQKLSKCWAKKYVNSVLKKKKISIKFENGVVPDKELAVEIALPVLYRIYGKKNIENQKPYQVFLVKNHWLISGSLPEGSFGGTFKIIISKKSGAVVYVMHYK